MDYRKPEFAIFMGEMERLFKADVLVSFIKSEFHRLLSVTSGDEHEALKSLASVKDDMPMQVWAIFTRACIQKRGNTTFQGRWDKMKERITQACATAETVIQMTIQVAVKHTPGASEQAIRKFAEESIELKENMDEVDTGVVMYFNSVSAIGD